MDVLPPNSELATLNDPKFVRDLSNDILMSEQEETEIEGVYLKRSGFFELMPALFILFNFYINYITSFLTYIDFQVQAETRFS
jgi:hypothetical protein